MFGAPDFQWYLCRHFVSQNLPGHNQAVENSVLEMCCFLGLVAIENDEELSSDNAAGPSTLSAPLVPVARRRLKRIPNAPYQSRVLP